MATRKTPTRNKLKKTINPVSKELSIEKDLRKSEEEIEQASRIKVPILTGQIADSYNTILKQFLAVDTNDWIKKLRDSLDQKLEKSDRRDIIRELKKYYKKEQLVFILGAGVSMSFRLPSWDTLLQKLMVTIIAKEKNTSSVLSKIFTKLFNPSPLIAGRYLQKHFESNDSVFESEVRKVLYEEIVRTTSSPLMDEIVRFCIAPGKSPNLNSIITYNFDDILEQSILKSSLDLPFKSIYGQGIDVDAGELPIYHVHGYLPQNGNLSEANQITFGESIYHKQYTNIYSWNNIVQINKFRDYNCLFIGTSITDPNTRRLLDIANQQRTEKKGSHFIFKLRYKKQEVIKAIEILLTQNKELMDEKSLANLKLEDTATILIETIESFEENDMKSFGIKTIWIDTYAEIPEIMKEIRKL